MRITFVCRKFDNVSGGVERMSIAMMNELVRRRHSIHLITWDKDEAQSYYPMNSEIQWHKLNMGDASQKASWGLRWKRQKYLRHLVQEIIDPDVIIAFQHGPFLTIALSVLGLDIPVIAAERNSPDRFNYLQAGKKKSLIFNSFRLAKAITVQLDGYRMGYPAYLRSRIKSIPNPVTPSNDYSEPAGNANDDRYLLTVGRMGYQKNLSALIQAFSMVAHQAPNWKLRIIGNGEEQPLLKSLVEKLGVTNRVIFQGTVKDVSHYYVTSHLFCLSSRWEGFPNALGEAMAHGLPAVGYSDCDGVNQLIINGETGLLAEGNGNISSLAEQLLCLMLDDYRRSVMGKRAIEVMKSYRPEDIYDRWENLFKKVVVS